MRAEQDQPLRQIFRPTKLLLLEGIDWQHSLKKMASNTKNFATGPRIHILRSWRAVILVQTGENCVSVTPQCFAFFRSNPVFIFIAGFVMEVVKLLRSTGVDIEQWIATGRLRVECFGSPGWVPSSGQTLFAPWEVLRSALPEQDEPSLMVLGENVYRITQDMLDIHPGGRDLIQMYQGADATLAFEAVGHDKDGNATGMLQAFEVGRFHKNLVENPRFDSKEASFDVVRMAWDCEFLWFVLRSYALCYYIIPHKRYFVTFVYRC